MRFVNPFNAHDAQRGLAVVPTVDMYVTARFEAVRALHAFREVYLKPIAQGMLQPTPRETVLLGLHYRIAALVRSAKTLNSVVHFQSLAAAGRSIFELGMDVMLFGADKTTESLVRLKAFARHGVTAASVPHGFHRISATAKGGRVSRGEH